MKRVRPEPGNGAPPHTKPSTGIIAQLRRRASGAKKPDYRTKLLAYSRFDSYKLNGEDSQLHWEALTHRSHRHVKLLQARDRRYRRDWCLGRLGITLHDTVPRCCGSLTTQTHTKVWCTQMTIGPIYLPYRPRHGPSC